jgi:subtilisin family serine protease
MVSRVLIVLSVFIPLVAYAGELKVAIIDTGLDTNDSRFLFNLCGKGHKDFTRTGLRDTNGHGTHVAGLIQAHAGDSPYCLLIIKYYDDAASVGENNRAFTDSIKYAADQGADIVNISGGGLTPDYEERSVIESHPEITYVVAAGNNDFNMDNPRTRSYPAGYGFRNIQVVGNWHNGRRVARSNYGALVTYWEDGFEVDSALPEGHHGTMTGTSMSCGIRTGKEVYARTHRTR